MSFGGVKAFFLIINTRKLSEISYVIISETVYSGIHMKMLSITLAEFQEILVGCDINGNKEVVCNISVMSSKDIL